MAKHLTPFKLIVLVVLTLVGLPVFAQKIIQVGDKYHLLSFDNKTYPGEFDNIYVDDYLEQNHYYFVKNNKTSVIPESELSKTNWAVFVPQYDKVYCRVSSNKQMSFIVKNNGKYGALNNKCTPSVDVVYDSIFSSHSFGNGTLTAIQKGNKLALLSWADDSVVIDQSFRFMYDQMYPEVSRNVVPYRIGEKFGFSYRYDRNLSMTDALFDEPIEKLDCFFTTTENGKRLYFYSYDYSRYTERDTFQLEIGNHVEFVALKDWSRFSGTGAPRMESSHFDYPYLFCGLDSKDSIFCYDVDKQTELQLFMAPEATYTVEVMEFEKYWMSDSKDRKWYVRTRVLLDNETAFESFTDLNTLIVMAAVEIPIETHLVLTQYALNGDYLRVSEYNPETEKDKSIGYFPYDRGRYEFSSHKPKNDSEHSGHSGGGGGGKWMDILWMGGR